MQRLRAYGRAEAVRGLRFLHQRRVTVAPAAHPHTSVSLPSTRVFQPCAQRRANDGWRLAVFASMKAFLCESTLS